MEQNTALRPGTLASPGHPLGLVDLAGLCELLRVSRSSAERLSKNDPNFPRPFKIARRRNVRFEDLKR